MADNLAHAEETTPAAFDIEQPACFYLGREYDLNARKVLPDKYVMYDARDLTTHGVIVGMTGSGKTGLAITILEEAAIDGVPCIIIDLKGDLTNLVLQFPELKPEQFQQWLHEEDALQKGMSLPDFAKQMAERWRRGLEDSEQKVERIRLLQQASERRVFVFTPGSEAGVPLSVLGTFSAPKGEVPREALTQKIDATAAALLGLTGLNVDPIQSREHVLISQLLFHAWGVQHLDIDLASLITQIQNPPIRTVGAYNMETFYPAKDRVKFASMLNNMLASPSFSVWTTGTPLELGSMLYKNGKPQQLIFYLAHLDDTQRMFFTTLLLAELLSWTRRQSGTSHLRALLYFDEVFGYLPPHPANPPSKIPLLTLLKQARAFGVGVLLATQNPIDLDYKALSNAGTWFIGKLQTERDKARLLDGLESVAAEQGSLADRAYLDRVIGSLGNRLFVMHDIHRPSPVLFQSRWTLSFLRGPMTRAEVAEIMEPMKPKDEPNASAFPTAIPLCTHCHAELGPGVTDRCPGCGQRPWANANYRLEDQAFRAKLMHSAATTTGPVSTMQHMPPVLPPDVTQFYLSPSFSTVSILYQSHVLGVGEIVFTVDKRKGKEHTETVRLLAKPSPAGHPINWDRAETIAGQLATMPLPGAQWDSVPDSLDTGRKLKSLEKAFAEYLYSTRKLSLFQNRALGLVSDPGESLDSFRDRCRQAAAAEASQALAMEKAKFTPRFQALGMTLPEDPRGADTSGSSFLGWLFSAVLPTPKDERPPSTRQEEKERKLKADYQAKQAEIHEKWKRVGGEYTAIQVKPRKADVHVTHFGLAWVPKPR